MKTLFCTLQIPRLCQLSIGLLIALCSTSGVLAEDAPAVVAVPPSATEQAMIVANEQALLNAVLASEVATLNEMLADDLVYVHENGLSDCPSFEFSVTKRKNSCAR